MSLRVLRSREPFSSLRREEIFEALSGVFEQVLGRSVPLSEGTTAADVEGWDSIAHVLLILGSEREFGVRFESSELANVANVGEFVTLVESKLG
jgi:acyl carrier protein